jgi:hypothetical protein
MYLGRTKEILYNKKKKEVAMEVDLFSSIKNFEKPAMNSFKGSALHHF